MKVAVIAPPWLKIPPTGYGGIENMIDTLVPGLHKLGVEVVLFTIGETTLKGAKLRHYYQDEQYHHIHKTYYETVAIQVTHRLYA